MEKTRRDMLTDALQMAWPAVLESFFVALAGMIDTMMVATLGSYAVAAVGLTQQPKFISLTVFFGINVAVSAIVARRKGEQRRRAANEMLATALIVATALCILITVLFLAGTPAMMRFAGSNADTHQSAVIYFRIIIGGSFFNVITMVINAAQRGSGNTRISMITNLVSSCVNILFNYLLIGGHFGFPALGVTGAALATVLGTVVAFMMSVRSLFLKNSYVSIPLILREKIGFAGDALQNIIRLGLNICFENLAMRVGFVATAMLAARLGTDEFAAHNVGMNIMGLAFSFADGMQAAGVALSGEALGAGDKERAKQYGSICQHIGLGISVCLSFLLIIGGRWFFSLYFTEPHIIDMGVLICRFICVIVLLQISQVIFSACLRAAGDVRYTLVVSLISVTLIRTVVTWLLVVVFHLGLTGIWLGVLSDQASRFLLMRHRFREGKWVDIRI
ncbi:MAG: MATE family efflux transporter [Lachnospiraceae bacterium]|nr:MATE family efflux transporter [Lachnospiraceae bacterium]